ncbi:MAG: hypothetical protein AAFU85_25655 [Planctomycetota bacterium]
MRSKLWILLVFAGIVSQWTPMTSGEEPVVALDGPSGEMLRSCFPAAKVEIVIQSDKEAWGRLNQRGLSLRRVHCVFYRSDYSTLASQLMRERLSNQGVRTVDLIAIHQRPRARLPKPTSRSRSLTNRAFRSPLPIQSQMPQLLLSEKLGAEVPELVALSER